MALGDDLGVVLVVGGCGFLGSNIVKLLCLPERPLATSVHVFSRNPTHNLHPDATYHAGDISNYQQVAALFSKIKPNVIIHTASPKYTTPEKILRQTNVDGTRILLQCAAESPDVQAFVYTSTDSAIVQAPGIKLTEDIAVLHTEKSRTNLYAKTKAIADFEVCAANKPGTLRTAVIRIAGLYGESDDNCIGTLLEAAKKGQHKVQIGDSKRHFEFIYVEKACVAHILAARGLLQEASTNSDHGTVSGEAFFISDDVSMPYFDFARKVYALAGYPVPTEEIQVLPFWLARWIAVVGEWLYWIFTLNTKTPQLKKLGVEYLAGGCEWDISKAKKVLGYEPVADQDAVLKKVVESEMERLGLQKEKAFKEH